MNVLITAGATREPIDDVRYISNVSSGGTGALLAAALTAAGHRVVLLRGTGAVSSPAGAEEEVFSSAADLETRLRRRLASGAIEAAIMAAAVADFHVEGATTGKRSSEPERLTLQLVRNPKILPRLKSFSPRALHVIGFKLTAGADAAVRHSAVAAQFFAGGVDTVVQNDLAEIRAVSPEAHPFWLYRTPTTPPETIHGAAALAQALHLLITRNTPARGGAEPPSSSPKPEFR